MSDVSAAQSAASVLTNGHGSNGTGNGHANPQLLPPSSTSSASSSAGEMSPRHAYQFGSGDNERLLSGAEADSALLAGAQKAFAKTGGKDGLSAEDIALQEAQYRKKERLTILRVIVVLLIVGVIVIGLVYAVSPHSNPSGSPPNPSECAIMCTGPVLQVVQFSGLFNDSKTFVDMPLLYDPDVVIQDFNAMTDFSQASVKAFLNRNFAPVCSDMLPWSPPDYREHPKFVKNISDHTFKEFALDVHSLWNLLGRQMDPSVAQFPRQHSLLPLRSPHMMVPGGRFCEFYYWDSYWVVRGLLVSGMVETARTVVNNLLGLVEDYGFVPNGSRRYYLNRSQPPMLTLMVRAVYDVTGDHTWLREVMPILQKEYAYWMEAKERTVVIQDDHNIFILNKYYTNWTHPRPESFVQDELTAWVLWQRLHNETVTPESTMTAEETYTPEAALLFAKEFATHHAKTLAQEDLRKGSNDNRKRQRAFKSIPSHRTGLAAAARVSARNSEESHSSGISGAETYRPMAKILEGMSAALPEPPHPMHDNETVIQTLYAQLAAAAETGWDFSSRWFEDRNDLSSVQTMNLVPVDLNAILFAVEVELSDFALVLDDPVLANHFEAAYTTRRQAIHDVLWNATAAQWQDWHIDHKQWREEVMLSNFVPLWAKCYDDKLVNEGAVVASLLQSGLIMPGGLSTTLNNNTQQWDWPNAWAPLQWMVVEGLRTVEYASASTEANFKLYNSSAHPSGEPVPKHACDIVKPESWVKCNERGEDCVWCFPSGAEISDAIGMHWVLSNFLAFNRTGYMFEKYFAPKLGGTGAGGEYEVQKGFGWTNGVVLDLLHRYGGRADFNLESLLTTDYLYAQMAPFAEIQVNPIFMHPPAQPADVPSDEDNENIVSAHIVEKQAKRHAEDLAEAEREEHTRDQEEEEAEAEEEDEQRRSSHD